MYVDVASLRGTRGLQVAELIHTRSLSGTSASSVEQEKRKGYMARAMRFNVGLGRAEPMSQREFFFLINAFSTSNRGMSKTASNRFLKTVKR